jgi:hypothetical protein
MEPSGAKLLGFFATSLTRSPLTEADTSIGQLQLTLLGLDLLLLLDYGLGLLGYFRSVKTLIGVLIVIRQPQPDLRHMG